MLKEKPRVIVIGVGGGNDVWGAWARGAEYIKGVELNQQILDIHHGVLSRYSKRIIEDRRVELLCAEGRSALMRDPTRYDVIQMSGVDTWTSLTSGAYVLAENYLYTVEAIRGMYDHLTDNGILCIGLFARIGPLRLLVNTWTVVENRINGRFENSVACLSCDDGLITVTLVKKGEFSSAELAALDQFTEQEGFPLVYHPHRTLGNPIERFVRAADKPAFIRDFPLNISPTPDDRPYFHNYMKGINPFEAKQFFADPVAMHGNPFFIFVQLLVSTIFAVVLILLPLTVSHLKGLQRKHLGEFLVYFMGLGMGFIAIEISMMQKLVLFLGHPLYSVTVTLFAMLVFAGIGSLISERWFRSPTRLATLLPLGLAVLIALFIQLSPKMVAGCIGWPTWARFVLTGAVLTPISMLLGVPFAYGIRLVNRYNATIIPWAWAVNGCTTVIGSIVAVIFSMSFGFNSVLIGAVAAYFIAFLAVRKLV
jgi:hypothetical protein